MVREGADDPIFGEVVRCGDEEVGGHNVGDYGAYTMDIAISLAWGCIGGEHEDDVSTLVCLTTRDIQLQALGGPSTWTHMDLHH